MLVNCNLWKALSVYKKKEGKSEIVRAVKSLLFWKWIWDRMTILLFGLFILEGVV